MNKKPLILAVILPLLAQPVTSVAVQPPPQSFETSKTPPFWSIGAYDGAILEFDSTSAHCGRYSLKATYPVATGGAYAQVHYDLRRYRTREVDVSLWARMPDATQGLKFIKIFGGYDGKGGYANTTLGLDYSGNDPAHPGGVWQVSFGDGSGVANGGNNAINLSGAYPEWVGRSYGLPGNVVITPQNAPWWNWDKNWHHFFFHVKFNSGTSAATEVNDGEFRVEIDGVTYVEAKGLFNRHWSNKPIDRVEFFGWAQNGTSPFNIAIDEVTIRVPGAL